MQIAAVVCANGAGHFRRVVGILHRLLASEPRHRVTVYCTERQTLALSSWWRLRELVDLGVELVTDIDCGPRWPLPADTIDLLAWREQLADHPAIARADLVLSDNLPAVLGLRPDAVLSGSFLWSEVLPEDGPVQEFIDDERALLRAHRPPMLCVGPIASPAVLHETTPIGLPWMCEEPVALPRTLAGPLRIGVCGGTTRAAGPEVIRLATALADRYRVTVDRAGEPTKGDPPPPYRLGLMSEVPIADVDLILCRPGAGTVMDCVATNTPFMTFHEHRSTEMSNTAARLADLGVAARLDLDQADEQLVATVEHLADPEAYHRASLHLHEQPKDGLDQAAEWLSDRLVHHRQSRASA